MTPQNHPFYQQIIPLASCWLLPEGRWRQVCMYDPSVLPTRRNHKGVYFLVLPNAEPKCHRNMECDEKANSKGSFGKLPFLLFSSPSLTSSHHFA